MSDDEPIEKYWPKICRTCKWLEWRLIDYVNVKCLHPKSEIPKIVKYNPVTGGTMESSTVYHTAWYAREDGQFCGPEGSMWEPNKRTRKRMNAALR